MKNKIIQIRTHIFIAGEGESEQSFVKWLQDLSEQQGLHVHLDFQNLEGGGYQAMLHRALHERKRKERAKAKFSILLVDSDRAACGHDDWSLSQLKERAAKEHFALCIQDPNLEGVFWRMLQNNTHAQPNNTKTENQLRQIWPTYQKPVDARTLAKKFSLEDLLRFAKVNAELHLLLSLIGWKLCSG